jgi:glycosyltransferase involved in cell wall biosynthesis
MIVINFSNQIAAGPKNISTNYIRQVLNNKDGNKYLFIIPRIEGFLHFENTELVTFKTIYVIPGGVQALINVFYVNIILLNFFSLKYNITSILAFGNFLFGTFSKANKVVLLHHPYIIDDQLFYQLPIKPRVIERIKRVLFYLTVKHVNHLVVQSDYMKGCFLRKFPNEHFKVEKIYNPISNNFSKNNISTRSIKANQQITIIYASRFYPHKNHDFIIQLAKRIKEKALNIRFIITVNDKAQETSDLLNVIKQGNLAVDNVGEISQEKLQELYLSCHLAIFPSKTETFGNPLVEALYFGLPVIAPSRDYAVDILAEAGIFYTPECVENCIQKMTDTINSEERYQNYSLKSLERAKVFPDAEKWFHYYQELISAKEPKFD